MAWHSPNILCMTPYLDYAIGRELTNIHYADFDKANFVWTHGIYKAIVAFFWYSLISQTNIAKKFWYELFLSRQEP